MAGHIFAIVFEKSNLPVGLIVQESNENCLFHPGRWKAPSASRFGTAGVKPDMAP